ncbi:MAG: hypothetical protein Q9222_002585 [Ikaeria aurantiellina]
MYTVRPCSPAKADVKASFRVYLSATALSSHGLNSGDICQLSTASHTSFPAIAWHASGQIKDSVIQTTKALQDMYALKLGDQVTLSPAPTPCLDANEVVVSIHQDSEQRPLSADRVERGHWSWLLAYELKQAAIICPGMILPPVHAVGEQRIFKIESINGSDEKMLYQTLSLWHVSVATGSSNSLSTAAGGNIGPFPLDTTAIAGLDDQISDLNSRIAAFSGDAHQRHRLHEPWSGGIILHGQSGTGKSMLLRMVSEAGWQKVLKVGSSVIEKGSEAIRKIFTDACDHQPSVIIFDDLDVIAGKPKPNYQPRSFDVASILCEELDKVWGSRVLVLAAARNLAFVDATLRCPDRFDEEIAIPVPDVGTRTEILNLALGMSKSTRDRTIMQVAERTHGYVGADLKRVLQVAMNRASSRDKGLDKDGKKIYDPEHPNPEPMSLSQIVADEDIEAALRKVRPTAMKEFSFDVPHVKWSDIGGQAEVKAALEKAIQWPIKHPEDMKSSGLRPKKGLLLYGPPGCSKTLAAKAVATEAGINFIAVKGAEFYSQYVGESERALRDIFQKARAASPSIIFFDEIDAIGSARTGSPQSGVSVLTTLLNLMDGIEALKGVFILAATNRPDVLDPALLRPGRLESALHVGPPDQQARTEIIDIETRKMPLSPDIDAARLAAESDGHSGAEVVSICQEAGYLAFGEHLKTGKPMLITQEHFRIALNKTPKRITADMFKIYEAWGEQ